MPGVNLTRDEARARAALIAAVHRYDIALDLSATGETFTSTTTIAFSCTAPGATTFADLIADEAPRITLNGRELDPAAAFADGRITLADLAAENVLTVRARCPYMHTGEGLHRFVDPSDGLTYLYAQLGPANARRVFADFEQPDLKSVFALTVTAPADWVLAGNAATPEPRRRDGGLATWSFPDTPRMPTYLVTLVAGPYHHVHAVHPGRDAAIPLGLYCRRSMAPHLDADELFTVTGQGLAFYEDRFRMGYPFGKYDQVFLPEFNWGAVENVACVTFRDEFLFRSRQTATAYEERAVVVLHEMAHMWFGDLVTMRWWDDVWLNESFAEWAGHWAAVGATRYDGAWVAFAGRKNWAYRADQLPSTHPVGADIPDLEAAETSFDGITYAKGAAALRQLVAWVGEPGFTAGLRDYFAAHAFGNAEFADLIGALQTSSGRDLSGWAARWLRTTGISILRPAVLSGPDGRYTSVVIEQAATGRSGSDADLRPHRLAVGLFDVTDAGLVRRSRVELDLVGASTLVPALVGLPAADLVLVNDGDLTYAKVRFDARSLATVTARIGELTEPLARAVCWSALWDMTRDAEFAASRFVRTVLAGLPSETGIGAFELLLDQACTALESFVAPADRDGLRGEWTAGLRALLAASDPGGDRQLALVRAIAATPGTDADHRLLAALLRDPATLPGLVLDVDLRWSVVTALARAGRLGLDEIDAEASRDPTITGREHAATARAATPDPAAKAAAWRDAVERADVGNGMRAALVAGFAQPGQENLLAPFVSRYFAAATRVWAATTSMTATTILTGLFPRFLPAAGVVDAARDWLATTSAGPAARRLVAEACADAERALAAQLADEREAAAAGDYAHGL